MVVVALLSVDLVESVELVSVYLVVNCILLCKLNIFFFTPKLNKYTRIVHNMYFGKGVGQGQKIGFL